MRELLWATLPIVFVVQIAATAILGIAHYMTLEARLETRIQQLAAGRVPLIAEPLWKMRYDQVTSVLEEIVRNAAIVTATVYDDTKAPVATARSSNLAANRFVELPIVYRNANMKAEAGLLRLGYTENVLLSELKREIAIPVFLAIAAALATLVALRMAANIYLGAPLKIMTDTILRSRREGRHYSAVIASRNEFGELARAFNEMQEANAAALSQLATLACQDALTGLPNRRGLSEQLKQASERDEDAKRDVAVHFIDLDDFKAINDTFGHETGDKFLIHVADQLRRVIGPQDWIARLGGDEFIVVQQDAPDEQKARALARRMMIALSTPFAIHDKKIAARASIGIALSSSTHAELEQLPALADIALYHSKARGTGTISVLSRSLLVAHSRGRQLEIALPQAFTERQFEVWYQAQFDVQTGAVCGLEALARWRHPVHGLVSPAEFLPLVEKTGNSGRLAEFVLEDACAKAARMLELGYGEIRVAVNLSPSELADISLVDIVKSLAERHEVPPAALEIEITEGTLINRVANTSAVIQALREMGVSIALDDFGTGYSSLAYLRHFPIDKIKIDKAFVRNIPNDGDDQAVVEMIAMLARKLGFKVVAEGIEREEQVRSVRAIGLDIGQGYIFHRPQPFAQLELFLNGYRPAGDAPLRAVG